MLHGRLHVGVTHHLHRQLRQNTGAGEIGAEGRAQSMAVDLPALVVVPCNSRPKAIFVECPDGGNPGKDEVCGQGR